MFKGTVAKQPVSFKNSEKGWKIVIKINIFGARNLDIINGMLSMVFLMSSNF